MSHHDDAALCANTAGVTTIPAGQTCGNGIAQPTWAACRNAAVWQLPGYQHPYCTHHAAIRIRAEAAITALRRPQASTTATAGQARAGTATPSSH